MTHFYLNPEVDIKRRLFNLEVSSLTTPDHLDARPSSCVFFYTNIHLDLPRTGLSDIDQNWAKLAPNGTDLGLFKIRFQNFLARRAKKF